MVMPSGEFKLHVSAFPAHADSFILPRTKMNTLGLAVIAPEYLDVSAALGHFCALACNGAHRSLEFVCVWTVKFFGLLQPPYRLVRLRRKEH